MNNTKRNLILVAFSLLQMQALAQVVFTEVSQSAGVDMLIPTNKMDGAGVAWFDYDNNGTIDLYVTGGENAQDGLFSNNGDGTFSNVTTAAGLAFTDSVPSFGVVTGDIDNDGDRDIFLTGLIGFHSRLLENNGDGTFSDISLAAGFSDTATYSHAATFGDFDLDGYLDLYVVSWVEDYITLQDSSGATIGYDHNCYANTFYKNNGNGTFTEAAAAYSIDNTGCGLATAFTDFDNDADVDIMIANDFGMWVSPSCLFQNDFPNDQFTDISAQSGMDIEQYGMGIAPGDYDHDGDLDYYSTSIGHNSMMQNQGDGTFIDIAESLGIENDTLEGTTRLVTSWGCGFVDLNNDSWDDLLVANGKVPAYQPNAVLDPNRLFLNDGAGGFTDISVAAGVNNTDRGRGMAYADYDNDGDIDFYVAVIDDDSASIKHSLLFRNESSNSNAWIGISLEGTASNRDGFGSHIRIVNGSNSWIREVGGGSSYRSQHSSIVHFGLGSSTQADSIIVTWPGGFTEVYTGLAANQIHHLVEGASTVEEQYNAISKITAWPVPANYRINLSVFVNEPMRAEVQLIDLAGRTIRLFAPQQFSVGGNTFEISLGSVPQGLYFVRIASTQGTMLQRVVVH